MQLADGSGDGAGVYQAFQSANDPYYNRARAIPENTNSSQARVIYTTSGLVFSDIALISR